MITTFLGSLLVGSALNQITEFINNPKGIINTLGASAPQTATFFMTYILIQAFIKSPLQLLRLPGLIIFWLKYRFATTPRQKAAVWQDTRPKYGTNVSAFKSCHQHGGLRSCALFADANGCFGAYHPQPQPAMCMLVGALWEAAVYVGKGSCVSGCSLMVRSNTNHLQLLPNVLTASVLLIRPP